MTEKEQSDIEIPTWLEDFLQKNQMQPNRMVVSGRRLYNVGKDPLTKHEGLCFMAQGYMEANGERGRGNIADWNKIRPINLTPKDSGQSK